MWLVSSCPTASAIMILTAPLAGRVCTRTTCARLCVGYGGVKMSQTDGALKDAQSDGGGRCTNGVARAVWKGEVPDQAKSQGKLPGGGTFHLGFGG